MNIKPILSPTNQTLLTVAVDPNDPKNLFTLLALPKTGDQVAFTDDDGTDKRYVVDHICHVYSVKAYGSSIASHTLKIRAYLA